VENDAELQQQQQQQQQAMRTIIDEPV